MNLCVACKNATEGYGDPRAYNPSTGEGEVTDLDEPGFTIPAVLLFLVLLFDVLPAVSHGAYDLLPVKEMYSDDVQEIDEIEQHISRAFQGIVTRFQLAGEVDTTGYVTPSQTLHNALTELRNMARGGSPAEGHKESLTVLLDTLEKQSTVIQYAQKTNSSLTPEERRTASSTVSTIQRMREVIFGLIALTRDHEAAVATMTNDPAERVRYSQKLQKFKDHVIYGLSGVAGAAVLGYVGWRVRQAWTNLEEPQTVPVLALPSVGGDTARFHPGRIANRVDDPGYREYLNSENGALQSEMQELRNVPASSLATAAVLAYEQNPDRERVIFYGRNEPKYKNVLALFSHKSATLPPWATLKWDVKRFFITNIDDMIPSGNSDDSQYVRNILSFVTNWEQTPELKILGLRPSITAKSINHNRVIEPYLTEMFAMYVKSLRGDVHSEVSNFANISLVRPKIETLSQKIGFGSLQMFADPADILYNSLMGVTPVQDVVAPLLFLALWAQTQKSIKVMTAQFT